ncbi:hypothetical protein D3C74_350220 [compost metagenome]
MNSLSITCKDAKTTFLLARRAERLARPLVDKIDGGMLNIEVVLDGGHYYTNTGGWHIGINVHRVKADCTLGKMALQAIAIRDSAELDRAIDRLRLEAEADELRRMATEAAARGEDADA